MGDQGGTMMTLGLGTFKRKPIRIVPDYDAFWIFAMCIVHGYRQVYEETPLHVAGFGPGWMIVGKDRDDFRGRLLIHNRDARILAVVENSNLGVLWADWMGRTLYDPFWGKNP